MASGRHVILVGPLPPPFYGQSVSFKMLVEEVERRGIPARVVDLAHGEASQKKLGMLTLHRVKDYLSILASYFRHAAFGKKNVYITIAQSSHGFVRDCAMIWFAALFGHRVVAHLKGGNYDNFYAAQPGWLRAVIRATLRRTHRILVLGERLRSMYDFDPRLADRIRVVSNGLPDDREPAVRGKQIAEGGPVRLLFLSNLIESKGYLDVLAAVRLLRDRLGPGAVRCDFYGLFLENPADDVRVTGPGHGRRLFEAFVEEHGLEECVAYHGVAAGDEKRAALERSHFFLLPTRYNSEGQPVSIIEAMAYGNVVVSTDYRAIPDMVVDGVTGALVPFGDHDAIAACVEEIVREPGRFERMSQAAVERYASGFTRRAHIENILPYVAEGVPQPPALSRAPA